MSIEPFQLVLTTAGTAILSAGDDVLWTNDGDQQFIADSEGEAIEPADLPDVVEWLVDNGYVPPRVPVEIIDENAEPGEDSGWFETLEDDADDEGDEDDGDEND